MTMDQIWAYEEQAVFALRGLYQRYGYTPYKMSQFEEYDLYVRNKDFLISDRIITFSGEGGKMYIYPAIDLYGGKAVRLLKGDYTRMTVYSDDPVSVAKDFAAAGVSHIHLVDLEGAKLGKPANLDTIAKIVETTGLFAQVGGGIRDMETVESYLFIGVSRVILGTAAVTNPAFLKEALAKYGDKIAVGVDLKDGFAAIRGWTETSDLQAEEFLGKMQELGVKTIICTDISRDGAMKGTNRELYRELSERFSIDLIASGGVSSMEDVTALAQMQLHGAIIGKACYTGAVDLKQAAEAAK